MSGKSLDHNFWALHFCSCWNCKLQISSSFKRHRIKTTKSRIKGTYYFGGFGQDRNDARRPDWWWGRSNCREDLPHDANVGDMKLPGGWLEGVVVDFPCPFWGEDVKGCKPTAVPRWYSSCVENIKSKGADWWIMWSGPLLIGLRLAEEEEDAWNCMLRNQKVGRTWRLAVRLGHVTTPVKLLGARWSAVTWCWKRTSWLTQMVRSVVVTLQRGSVLLINGNWTQRETNFTPAGGNSRKYLIKYMTGDGVLLISSCKTSLCSN